MAYVVAEFKDDRALLAAARRLRALGHARLDAYSPFPLHGAEEALGLKPSKVPLIALVGGVVGAASGYVMQWWMNAVDFPINVGNRLPHSPPTNIPITFETGVLIAALSIVIGMCALCGFPRTYHPVFEVEAFRTATVDALWLSVDMAGEAAAPVMDELRKLEAVQVFEAEEGR